MSRLGIALFTRRPLALTAAGMVFVERARQVLASIDDLVEATRAAAEGTAGALKVGYILSAAYDTIPELRPAIELISPAIVIDTAEDWSVG